MKFIITFFLLLIITPSVYSQNNYYYAVNATILNIRKKPNIKSRIIIGLKKYSIVTLIKKTDNYNIIEGVKANWYKIKTENGKVGYAFSKYLKSVNKNEIINYRLTQLKKKIPKPENGIAFYHSEKKYHNGDAGYCWLEQAGFRINFIKKDIALWIKYVGFSNHEIENIEIKNRWYIFKIKEEKYSLKIKIISNGKKLRLNINKPYADFSGMYQLGKKKFYKTSCKKSYK